MLKPGTWICRIFKMFADLPDQQGQRYAKSNIAQSITIPAGPGSILLRVIDPNRSKCRPLHKTL
jgi:hypothetical protein